MLFRAEETDELPKGESLDREEKKCENWDLKSYHI